MKYIVKLALVGRPNVGKSTLFNKITTTHDALVTKHCNMTRDRNYGIRRVKEYQFIVIDTAGIDDKKKVKLGSIDHTILLQCDKAIEESNIILFIVDAHSGLMPGDFDIMKRIRSSNKPLFLAVNKIDGVNQNISATEFSSLGIKNIYFIAASTGRGITQLLKQLYLWCKNHLNNSNQKFLLSCKTSHLFLKNSENSCSTNFIYLAIVGRPNVGKSTLINRLLGEERVIVFNMPGTTRDSIYIPFEYKEFKYILIDTAGLRKRRKVCDECEKLSIITTLQSIYKANVVIMVLDANHPICDQDLSILNLILTNGRSLVIIVNKWDNVSHLMKQKFKGNLLFRLKFINFVRIHFISAISLSRQEIENIFQSVREAYLNSTKKLSSRKLTRIMKNAIEEHNLPLSSNIKFKYAHSGGYNPPIVVIHGRHFNKLPHSYKNYLNNYFRRSLELHGTPIKIYLKEQK
ncbi:MAG: ribosome biogenesis GTPase Der [Candidatus Dasytiphilus stammeri]